MKPADLQIVKAAKPRSLAVAIGTGLLFVLILFLAFGSWFQVDQGERGVVLRNGKLVRVAEPGLDFKTPFIDNVSVVSVRDHTFVFENLEAYSYDQQPATLRVSVTYRVPAERVAELPSTAPSTICRDACWSARRPTPSRTCSAASPPCAIQERQKLGLDVNTAVVEAMDGAPVQVVGVQIEEVGFSKAYEHSIEQRMLAQVQIETTRQQKETAVINAEIQVVKAKAEADARRQQFTAEADGIRLRGEAEAAAIRAKAEALAANTNLVGLNAVEKWDGVLPTTQVPARRCPSSASSNRAVGGLAPPGVVHQPGAGQRLLKYQPCTMISALDSSAEIPVSLHALHHDLQVQRLAESQQAAHDQRAAFAALRLHEAAVDLDRVDAELVQVAERRVAGAEIVDVDARADLAQAVEGHVQCLGVLDQRPRSIPPTPARRPAPARQSAFPGGEWTSGWRW